MSDVLDRADAPALPPTPDFDCYPVDAEIAGVAARGDHVAVDWSDGRASRFHAVWLRDNVADEATINPVTREQKIDISRLPDDLAVVDASVDGAGALAVHWTDGADGRFHPGWLRAHDYSGDTAPDPGAIAPETWDCADLAEPPSFDGTAVLADDGVLNAWLRALARFGVARLTGVAPEAGMVTRVGQRIGIIRETNFGQIFDVQAKVDPDSNAYTALELPPHTDLPTREYEPGLQLLHCLANTAQGGHAVTVDAYRVAEDLRREDAAAFTALTTIPWTFTNRARDTDYRWRTPMIVLDDEGQFREVRINGFLRGPLNVPYDRVAEAYRSVRILFARLREPRYRMTFGYRPGDLVGYDNRRVLHAREAFEPTTGERWLQGCYVEREELTSRLRILARRQREAALRGG